MIIFPSNTVVLNGISEARIVTADSPALLANAVAALVGQGWLADDQEFYVVPQETFQKLVVKPQLR